LAGDKLRATIQVDVDGLGVLLRHHGLQVAARERDFIFLSGLPRFLDLFARWDVKATFFVVGTDLQIPDKLKVLERLVDEGHEIGNHTANHPLSLSSLSVEEQREEIGCCDALCQKLLGVKPVGFRAPNFDVGEETAAVLDEMGYLYDSSVLAMPYGPLLRWCKDRVSTKVATKTRYLGCAAFGLASLHPYPLGARALWMRGASKLVEVPVTTMPFLRLPFHASFNLALNSFGMGNSLFNIGYACTWRTKTPLNYVFHVCELAELGDDRRLDKHWGLTLPVEERERVADRLIEKIKSKYQVMTTQSYVQQMQRGTACPV
jgi:peptidoglycan-N-acetylglucosamine deacetylase